MASLLRLTNIDLLASSRPKQLPFSIGIEGYKDAMNVILREGEPLPCEKTKRFPTAIQNQRTCKINVRRGESDKASECPLLGQVILRGIPAAPARQERVFVTLRVSKKAEFTVEASTRSGISESI